MAFVNEKDIQEAASWIWKNKHDGFWTPYTITALNIADKNNPHFSFELAQDIFSELSKRRLITTKIFQSNNKLFPAYGLNFNKEKEWENLIEKTGFWKLKAWPSIKWLGRKSWLVILFVLSTLLASFLGEVAKSKAQKYLASAPQEPQTPQATPLR
jgi:hypothetical protein